MPIRVAYLEEHADVGGAEINILKLIEDLPTDDFETIVICPKEGPLTKRVRSIGGNVAIVPRLSVCSTSLFIIGKKITNPFAVCWNIVSFFPIAWKLKKFLKSNQIQVVHTNSMLAHFFGGIACRLAGCRCLWHIQDIVDPFQFFGLFRKVLNIAGGWLPHRIVVISKAVGEMFAGRSLKKIALVYNGTEISHLIGKNCNGRIRKEFGIHNNEIVIAIIGRIVHWKGHRVFLRSAQRIVKKIEHARFLIVGHPAFGGQEYFNEIKKTAQKVGKRNSVIVTGYREDIAEVISGIDILVNASTLPEPFGLTIIEGMAYGKAVIGVNSGGIPEIVNDGVTGKLVKPNDDEALANAIIELIVDSDLRQQIGLAGREHVLKNFSSRRFIKEMASVYQGLAFS